MSLLTIAQSVCGVLGLPVLSTVYGNTNETAVQIRRQAELVIKNDLLKRFDWPELTKVAEITLATDTETYAKPSDFQRHISDTHYDEAKQMKARFPTSPQEWRAREVVLPSAGIPVNLRFFGAKAKQLYVKPIPTSSENGQIISYEYISHTIIKPVTWTASASFNPGAYTWYEGNIYYTVLGGTTGSTPPTHTSSSTSDGGVTWRYEGISYTNFLADTDECVIPEDIVILGVLMHFKIGKTMEYQYYEGLYERTIKRTLAEKIGAGEIAMDGQNNTELFRIPDTGVGS